MKKIFLFLFCSLIFETAFTQMNNVKKYLYYDRFISAENELNKLLKKDPTNVEVYYWLAITNVYQNKIIEAKKIINNGFLKTKNAPLLQVAMGHINLLENKKTEARSLFDKALAEVSENKKIEAMIAVGRGCADGTNLQGDVPFGIEILKQAALKETKNAELYLLLGSLYKKQGYEKEWEAIGMYKKAAEVDPFYLARSEYKIGQLFMSQNNNEVTEMHYEAAIKSDPFFSPAYLAFFNYSSQRNTQNAVKYLDLYIKNSDINCDILILQCDYLYRAGMNQESLNKLKEIEKGTCKNESVIKSIYAYNYSQLGDTLNAKSYIEDYISSTSAETISANDYMFAGDIEFKFPGQENKAIEYYTNYINKPITQENKVYGMLKCASFFEKKKAYKQASEWYQKIVVTKEKPSSTDYYKLGTMQYFSGDYDNSGKTFAIYSKKFTTDWRGPLWQARNASMLDSTMVTAAAAPYYEKFISLGTIDGSGKKIFIEAYRYLFSYQYNYKKNKAAAIEYLDKILLIESDNIEAKDYKQKIIGN